MINRNENQDESFKKASEMLTRMSHDSDLPPHPGFKEALKQRILDARQQKNMPFFSWFNGWSPKFAYGGTVALVAVIILMLVLNPFSKTIPTVYAHDNFSLSAETEDSLGIDPSTSFILESRDALDMDFVKKYLKIEPQVAFELKELDDHRVRVQFSQELDAGTMIRFLLTTQLVNVDTTTQERPYSWAFQVKNSFHVLSTIPANKTTSVPLDSGIEVVFSHENVSVEEFEKAFSITPNIKGHIEKSGRTLVFVPEKLNSATYYAVKINASLHPDGTDETLGQEYSFAFETGTEGRLGFFDVFQKIVTTDPTSKAQFQFSDYGFDEAAENNKKMSMEIYRFPTYETFRTSVGKSMIDSWRVQRSYKEYVPMEILTSIGTFRPQIKGEYYDMIGETPVNLEEGFYGVVLTRNTQSTWFFIQSVTIGGTLISAGEKSLVWAHDLKTKQPLALGLIRSLSVTNEKEQTIDVKEIGLTGIDGTASVKINEDVVMIEVNSLTRKVLLSIGQNSNWAYGSWWPGQPAGVIVEDDYIGYLYTDRPVYKQQDQIHLWGYLKKRNGDALPQKGFVSLTSNVYGYDQPYQFSPVEYASTPIELKADGFFTAQLVLPKVAYSDYIVGIKLGDATPISRSISVQEYRKPTYLIDLDLDRSAAIVGDSVKFIARAQYFDGTPASGKTINVGFDWDDGISYVTSSEGEVIGEINVPSTSIYNIRAQLAEPGQIPANSSEFIHVYESSIELKTDAKLKNKIVTLEIDSRRVEITESFLLDDHVKNVRPNTSVKIQGTQIWYEQIPNGEFYDFISKTVQKSYEYKRHDDVIYSNNIVTDANGKGSISFPTTRDDAYYEVHVSAVDEKNREVIKSVYPYSENYFGYDGYNEQNSTESLSFQDVNRAFESWEDPGYIVGEKVQLEVQQFGKRFKMIDSSQFLFAQAQRGVQQYGISNGSTYSFEFEERDVPNIYVYGVLFTGSEYVTVDSYGYGTSGHVVGFDTESRKLTVEVATDAKSYRPGSIAKATIEVKDQAGQPVAAEVNLSVVDEAYFAVFPDVANPLGSLYRSLPSGVTAVLTSHRQEKMMGGAEGGGGGDGEIRGDFLDTSAFVMTKTGKDGKAIVDLPLAENITSWRITTQAIDSTRLQAGMITTNITTTLPFFIHAGVQPTYLTADRPEILVTAAGTGVKLTDQIAYEISVENTQIGFSMETSVGALAHLPLGELPEGTQKIIIKAKTGVLSDAVAHTVQVMKSRLTTPVVEQQLLATDSKLSGSTDGMTMITFMDANQGKFYEALLNLAWRYGDRADEVVTRTVATELLNHHFDEQRLVPETNTQTYQEFNGGIRLLGYATQDPVLTAKVALLQDTPFNEQKMRGSLMSELYRTDQGADPLTQEQAAWALAGLSALNTPVLAEVKRFAREQTLSDQAKLAIAIAYLYAGDGESARLIYQDFIQRAQRDLSYVWIERSTPEETSEINAQLLLLASGLNEVTDRDGLWMYLNQSHSGKVLILLEQLAAIKQALTFLPSGESIVSYRLADESKRIELVHGRTHRVAVTSEQLSMLDPKIEQGHVSVTTRFEKPLLQTSVTDSQISVQRRYAFPGAPGDRRSFKQGDIVEVELSYQINHKLPFEYFQITDALPSGLTPLTWRDANAFADNNHCVTYPDTDVDQTLKFVVYNETFRYDCLINTRVYFARVMNTGTFKAEAASIRSMQDPSLVNFSNETTISIHE